MIPLDIFEKWYLRLDGEARRFLNETEYREYQSIPEREKSSQLKALLEKPIAQFTAVNDTYFRARWSEVLNAVHPGKEITLLEVASGDADMIPRMMARTRPHNRYITANMNRKLTQSLREKTRDIPLEVVVFEEDAAGIDRCLTAESVDIIAFQHAANDVIQAILCDQEGVDTISTDWMATLPEMIRILQREIAQNTLEQHAKAQFLSLLDTLSGVLKSDGTIVMNHYMFQLDLDWGYPPDLWENLIPIVREWIKELPQVREVFFEGFDPQWWMFCQMKR